MSAITLDAVTAGHGGVTAIRAVDVSVSAGEIVALLGANGAGKTTAVRVVCGLTEVSSGSISLVGTDVTRLGPAGRARLGLATVPDDRGVFRQLTVADNLRLGWSGGDVAVELDALFPELVPLLGRRAGLLSGGEQTLVALARALARRPRAIVVDELTAGLAPVLAASALGVLRRVAREWETGVLLAEQSAHVVLPFADRACVLSRGRVVLSGRSSDIANRPDLLESTYLGPLL